MYPEFKLIKDWYLETDILGVKNKILIHTKGQVFKSNDSGEYHITHGGWSEENPRIGGRIITDEQGMSSAQDVDGGLLFEKVIQKELNLHIEEISEDDDNVERNWRIQLDVKTTRKKLNEIQHLVDKYIKPIL